MYVYIHTGTCIISDLNFSESNPNLEILKFLSYLIQHWYSVCIDILDLISCLLEKSATGEPVLVSILLIDLANHPKAATGKNCFT